MSMQVTAQYLDVGWQRCTEWSPIQTSECHSPCSSLLSASVSSKLNLNVCVTTVDEYGIGVLKNSNCFYYFNAHIHTLRQKSHRFSLSSLSSLQKYIINRGYEHVSSHNMHSSYSIWHPVQIWTRLQLT